MLNDEYLILNINIQNVQYKLKLNQNTSLFNLKSIINNIVLLYHKNIYNDLVNNTFTQNNHFINNNVNNIVNESNVIIFKQFDDNDDNNYFIKIDDGSEDEQFVKVSIKPNTNFADNLNKLNEFTVGIDDVVTQFTIDWETEKPLIQANSINKEANEKGNHDIIIQYIKKLNLGLELQYCGTKFKLAILNNKQYNLVKFMKKKEKSSYTCTLQYRVRTLNLNFLYFFFTSHTRNFVCVF